MEWVIESYDRRTDRDAEHSFATESAFISAAGDLLLATSGRGFVSATLPDGTIVRDERALRALIAASTRLGVEADRQAIQKTLRKPPLATPQKCWRSRALSQTIPKSVDCCIISLCCGDDLTEEHRPCRPNPSAPSASPFTPASQRTIRPRRTKSVNCVRYRGPHGLDGRERLSGSRGQRGQVEREPARVRRALCKDASRRQFDLIAAWSVDRPRPQPAEQDLVGFLTEVHALGINLSPASAGHRRLPPPQPVRPYSR